MNGHSALGDILRAASLLHDQLEAARSQLKCLMGCGAKSHQLGGILPRSKAVRGGCVRRHELAHALVRCGCSRALPHGPQPAAEAAERAHGGAQAKKALARKKAAAAAKKGAGGSAAAAAAREAKERAKKAKKKDTSHFNQARRRPGWGARGRMARGCLGWPQDGRAADGFARACTACIELCVGAGACASP